MKSHKLMPRIRFSSQPRSFLAAAAFEAAAAAFEAAAAAIPSDNLQGRSGKRGENMIALKKKKDLVKRLKLCKRLTKNVSERARVCV